MSFINGPCIYLSVRVFLLFYCHLFIYTQANPIYYFLIWPKTSGAYIFQEVEDQDPHRTWIRQSHPLFVQCPDQLRLVEEQKGRAKQHFVQQCRTVELKAHLPLALPLHSLEN